MLSGLIHGIFKENVKQFTTIRKIFFFFLSRVKNCLFSTMQSDYVDVCIKQRLECSNASLEKNKAVVCNWLKDFCDVFLYKRVTLC